MSNSPEEGMAEVDDLVVKKLKRTNQKKTKKEGGEKTKKVFLLLGKASFIFQIHLLTPKIMDKASMCHSFCTRNHMHLANFFDLCTTR